MKRLFVFLLLAAALLTGCTRSEPSTVATISPGPADAAWEYAVTE